MSPTDFEPGPLATVAYEPADTGWTLVFTRDLPHSPEKVWAALTERDQLGQWAPFVPNRDLDVPGDATFTMEDGSDSVEQSADVLRADAPSRARVQMGRRPAPLGVGADLRWALDSHSAIPTKSETGCQSSPPAGTCASSWPTACWRESPYPASSARTPKTTGGKTYPMPTPRRSTCFHVTNPVPLNPEGVVTRFRGACRDVGASRMSSQLDLLVLPLGGPVEAGDQPHPVDPAEIPVDEAVRALVSSEAPSVRPRCHAAYSSQSWDSR